MSSKSVDKLTHTALLNDIKQIIEQERSKVKQAVNHAMVQAYWHIGRLIVRDEQQGQSRAQYGKAQLKQLSQQLSVEFGKGFDMTNLRNMRRFYLAFEKRDALRLELSWTHYRALIRIANPLAREWYVDEAIQQSWSARALERQIHTSYYERLLASKAKAPVAQEAQNKTQPLLETPKDYLRDPYILDFLNLQDKTYQENDLEQGIINNLQQFLLELGKGFAFVERQKRLRFDDEDFYLDLVFYNFKLKCFLHLCKQIYLTLWQMDMYRMYGMSRWHGCQRATTYVRLYDEQYKGEDDNPTIGLVLCSEKSEAVVKYSVLTEQKQLFAAKYLPYLLSEQELKKELQRERQQVQAQLALKQQKVDK